MSEIPEDISVTATYLAGEIQDDMSWRGCRDIVAQAILAERERCAKIAEAWAETLHGHHDLASGARYGARAIAGEIRGTSTP